MSISMVQSFHLSASAERIISESLILKHYFSADCCCGWSENSMLLSLFSIQSPCRCAELPGLMVDFSNLFCVQRFIMLKQFSYSLFPILDNAAVVNPGIPRQSSMCDDRCCTPTGHAWSNTGSAQINETTMTAQGPCVGNATVTSGAQTAVAPGEIIKSGLVPASFMAIRRAYQICLVWMAR